MANTFSSAAANIASIVDNSEVRSIDKEFKVLELHDTPLVAWLGESDPVYLGEDLTYEKIVQLALPRTVTTTEAVVTADTSVTFSTSDAARLQVGHMLKSMGDGSVHNAEILQVITGGTTTVGVTRGIGPTSATTHADTTVWMVMAPLFADGAAFEQSVSTLGEFKTFLPFIIQYADAVTPIRSATRTYLEKQEDPLMFRLKRLRKERIPELEALLLHGETQTITASVSGSPAGIDALISTNSTAVSAALTATHIEDMLEDLYDYGNTDGVTIIGDNRMQRIWDTVWRQYYSAEGEPENRDSVGFAVTKYYSRSLGRYVDFMRVERSKMSQSSTGGRLYFLRKNSWELHPLKWMHGSGWHEVERTVAHRGVLGKQVLMFNAYVFAVSDERLNGKLTSITTTPSSYAGYV